MRPLDLQEEVLNPWKIPISPAYMLEIPTFGISYMPRARSFPLKVSGREQYVLLQGRLGEPMYFAGRAYICLSTNIRAIN
jgi:hypothetical protein